MKQIKEEKRLIDAKVLLGYLNEEYEKTHVKRLEPEGAEKDEFQEAVQDFKSFIIRDTINGIIDYITAMEMEFIIIPDEKGGE